MEFMDPRYFLRQELKRLYEHNLNIQKYFLRLKVGCNCAERTCDFPKKYWMDVKEDFAAFLSKNASGLATQKIQIMIFENKIEVRYNNDLAGEIKATKNMFRKISDKVCGLSEKSAQIAASSIKALCKNAKLRHFDAIVNINGMRKQIYYKDFLVNPRILFEDSIEEDEKCMLEA